MKTLDEHQCAHCGKFFYVESGEEPMVCPLCGCREWDWTDTVQIGGKNE